MSASGVQRVSAPVPARRARDARRFGAFVTLTAFVALVTTIARPAPAPGAATTLALEPARAPEFKIRAVTGETLALEKLVAGGPLVLDFWATWCRPCLDELPELEALY